MENKGIIPKVYTPKFQGTVEFFGTGGTRKPDYTWDVKAHYEVEDKRVKKIVVLAHVTKGTFRTIGIIGTPADREIMTHQQEATQRTGDWVWDIITNFGGTLLDVVNQYLQSQGQGVITRYTYETQFFPAVAGYGTMMLVYYDQVVGIGTSIISFSIFQTNSRVFVEIERANNEISTETLALTLNASALDNFPDNPLSLQAPDAAARNNKRQSLIENWRNKIFTEIKADDGKIIKDAFGTDVTEDLTIEFNF
ncbi:MAG: hypothetical protein LBE13_09540 [Bacteroidales bacterium]|nr:hypothetical protein [Bacteroidales bacterium]